MEGENGISDKELWSKEEIIKCINCGTSMINACRCPCPNCGYIMECS